MLCPYALSESFKRSRGRMYTVVDFHINGILRCNRAAQVCEIIDLF